MDVAKNQSSLCDKQCVFRIYQILLEFYTLNQAMFEWYYFLVVNPR